MAQLALPLSGVQLRSSTAYAAKENGAELNNLSVSKAITSLRVSKARYVPGEEAELIFKLKDEEQWQGKLNVQIYNLNTLITEGSRPVTVLKGQGDLSVKWKTPEDDFTGYLVKAWVSGEADDDYITAAVDVSSDWKRYPRYGYTGEFGSETPDESDAKFKQLSQEYYLNGYQFYDWMWRHDVSVYSKMDADGKPLKDDEGNFVEEDFTANTHYLDLLQRRLYPLTIKQQVEAAQKYGSAAMAYEMNYAARESYEDYGVSPKWGLYDSEQIDPVDPQKSQSGYHFNFNGKETALYLQDPGNKEWQNYITKQFDRAVNVFGFDGIHLDQWGASDNNYLYDYNGNKRHYSLDYDQLINSVKDSLVDNNPAKSDVTFNMVGGNADYSAVPNPETKTDFDYSEVWHDRDHYRDLQKIVEDTRAKNGGKAMVIAGYMNMKEATGIKTHGTEAQDVPAAINYQSRISKVQNSWVGNFGRKDTDAVTFTVNAPAAGMYKLILHYGQGNVSGHPEGKLTVNNEIAAKAIPFSNNTGWGNPSAKAEVTATLKEGNNTVMLTLNTNNLWLNLHSLEVQGQDTKQSYDAVDAKLNSVKVDQYSHVYYFDTKNDYVSFNVKVPAEGDYSLGFNYASDWQEVSRTLLINNVSQGEVSFPGQGGWTKFALKDNMATVHLNAGDNTITLKAPKNDLGIKLRYLTLGGQRYEAAEAEIPQTNSVSFNMSMTDNFGNSEQTVTYSVYTDQQLDKLTVMYRGGNSPVMSVLVDGEPAQDAQNITFAKTAGEWDGPMLAKELPVAIPPGNCKITLKMESSGQYINVGGIIAGDYEYSTGDAELTNGVSAVVGYVSEFNNENDRIVFNVNVAEAGIYTLGWVFQNLGTATISRIVYAGDSAGFSAAFAPTSGSQWEEAVQTGIPLVQGRNQIVIQMSEGTDSGIRVDKLKVTQDRPDAITRMYEAESTQETNDLTFSLFKDTVINFGEVGQQVTYPVTIPQSGEQSLIFTYSNPGEYTNRSLYINGIRAKGSTGDNLEVAFNGTGGVDEYSEEAYVIVPYMEAGNHTITLKMEADNTAGMIQLRGVAIGYFNEPSVRLMDAALSAMGATHIEIGTADNAEGPNMLANEYYPNRSKKMDQSTKEAMKDYYKFFAAYENLLYDSKAVSDREVAVKDAAGMDVELSRDGSENTLWYTVRSENKSDRYETYDVVHLVNLLNNDSNWRNSANEPHVQKNLKVTYPIRVSAQYAPGLKVYAATPDQHGGTMQELSYTWEGDQIVLDVPSVEYWTMLVVDYKPRQAEVQKLFPDAGNEPSPTPAMPGNSIDAARAVPAVDTRVISEQELKTAQGKTVDIALNDQVKSILLPLNAGELIGSSKLVIHIDGLSLILKADELKELAVSATAGKGTCLELTISKAAAPSTDALSPPKEYTLKSKVYTFGYGFKDKDGKSIATPELSLQATVEISVTDAKLKGKLLGLYIKEQGDGSYRYAGGGFDASAGTLDAQLVNQGEFAVYERLKAFSDVPSTHWAYEAVSSLVAKQVVTGTTTDHYSPSVTTTRAEIAVMLVRALGLRNSGDQAVFADVSDSAWYAAEVSAAYTAGLIQGRRVGEFLPDAPVTRQELAILLLRAFQKSGGQPGGTVAADYSDDSGIAEWAREAVNKASSSGLFTGNAAGNFAPLRPSTRAEIAQAIDRMLNLINR